MNLEEMYVKSCAEIKAYEEKKKLLEQEHVRKSIAGQSVPVFVLNNSGYLPPQYSINIFPHRRGGETPLHCHEFFEIIYVYQGRAFLNIHGSVHTLSAGDICLLNLQAVHALSVPDDDTSVVFNVVIMPDKLHEIYLEIVSSDDIIAKFFLDSIQKPENKNQYILFHGTVAAHDAEISIQKLISEFYRASEYTEIMMSNNFVSFMIELSRWQLALQEDPQTHLKKANFLEIIRYIENHCADVNLSVLSQRFHYSSNYIALLIKKYSGQNFTSLLQDIRFKKAASLLASTSRTIPDIMETVGYTNRTWFTSRFFTIYGIRPQDFRKKYGSQK